MINWSAKIVLGVQFAGAVSKVVDDINASPDILKDTKLTYIWRDSGCNYTQGIDAVIDLYNENVSAVIG